MKKQPLTLAMIEPMALYSLPKVAKVLCVGWKTVKKFITDGTLPFVMVRKRKKIFGKDVLIYVALTDSLPRPLTHAEAQQCVHETLKRFRDMKAKDADNRKQKTK